MKLSFMFVWKSKGIVSPYGAPVSSPQDFSLVGLVLCSIFSFLCVGVEGGWGGVVDILTTLSVSFLFASSDYHFGI